MQLNSLPITWLVITSLLFGCKSDQKNINIDSIKGHSDNCQFTTKEGQLFVAANPSEKSVQAFEKAKKDYIDAPDDLENIIWFGRRTAYLGCYSDAIDIYTRGLQEFPNEARLLRHRGHRYISMREYDLAIQDLALAADLIKGKENTIEQDGLPNDQNIPVSTLHGNIWYHLGLAHYLKHDYGRALTSFTSCRNTGSNDDNIVSSTHWIYMINKRMGNEEEAQQSLDIISEDMSVIENQSYHNLCLFYKGLLTLENLVPEDGSPAGEAVKYGIANYYFYNEDKDKAKIELASILEGKSWSSFGFICAESDLNHYYK